MTLNNIVLGLLNFLKKEIWYPAKLIGTGIGYV